MTVFAILTLLLVALPLLRSEPICQNPPPPASFIPNLANCTSLVDWIYAISGLQDDQPILWSRNPSSFVRNRRLPYSFKDPLESSDCEFIVDVLRGGSQDTFPTKLIAEKAGEIVEKCMERGIDGAETVGAAAVGPKLVIAVILMRKGWKGNSVSEGLVELNMRNVTLLRPGNFSGLDMSPIDVG